MKKQFLNLGKALNKAEQKQINGGALQKPRCGEDPYACPYGYICVGKECLRTAM